MLKITVIVPTYKPEGYLWDCLGSLCKQTLGKNDFEVIVVLNGEKYPYENDIIKFIGDNRDCQFKYLYSSSAGVSNARNVGLANSMGEYIAFIDDDDFVSENYLEELFKHASIDTIPVCRPLSFEDGTNVYKAYSITKDFDRYNQKGKVPFYKPIRFFNGPVYKLIHKDIIGDRRFDIRFKNGEDSLFMFLVSDRIKYVEFAKKDVVYYRRIRKGSATQKIKPFGYNIRNYSKLIWVQTGIYFKNFPKYNILFYCGSIMGRIKSILLD